jgi:hypothetical protein
MNRITAASLAFVTALSLVPSAAYAQNANSTAARLAALEAKVAKLEGNIVADDLVGDYRLVGFLADVDASNPPAIGVAVAYGTVTLLANGTGSIQTATIEGTNLVLSAPAQESPIFQQDSNTPINWSYADGTLTLTSPEEALTFNVSAGGRVMTLAAIGDDGDKDLVILTRLR